jgi:hypothetical protein
MIEMVAADPISQSQIHNLQIKKEKDNAMRLKASEQERGVGFAFA